MTFKHRMLEEALKELGPSSAMQLAQHTGLPVKFVHQAMSIIVKGGDAYVMDWRRDPGEENIYRVFHTGKGVNITKAFATQREKIRKKLDKEKKAKAAREEAAKPKPLMKNPRPDIAASWIPRKDLTLTAVQP